jgi:transcriptional regulator with XRE-family HTH domain
MSTRILIGLRIYANLSQRKLAALLDIDESQVSRDERNEYRNITLERASRIVEILRAQVEMQVTTSVDPEGVQGELAEV